jgi:hypothetical protein
MAATEPMIPLEEAEDLYGGSDDPESYQVLSFDPGSDVGWAVFQVHPEAMGPDPDIRVMDNIEWWSAGQFHGPIYENADRMVEMVNAWPGARLTTEDFMIRQRAVELSPVELNAIVGWAIRPRYFVRQTSALALSTVTDDRLKAWGFWIPGKEDARNAVSHALTFLKRKKDQEVRSARAAGRGTV